VFLTLAFSIESIIVSACARFYASSKSEVKWIVDCCLHKIAQRVKLIQKFNDLMLFFVGKEFLMVKCVNKKILRKSLSCSQSPFKVDFNFWLTKVKIQQKSVALSISSTSFSCTLY
jgi:hypothetical protein